MSVVPGAIADARPVAALIVATDVALLAHVPPPVLVNKVVAPSHILVAPIMAGGSEFTVMVLVVGQPDAGV